MMATVRDACERALTTEWQYTADIARVVGVRSGTAHRSLSKLMLYGVCEKRPGEVGTQWRLRA